MLAIFYLVAGFVLGCLVAFSIHKFLSVREIHDSLSDNRKEALKRALKKGPILYQNNVGGIIAICRASDFDKAFEEYQKSGKKGVKIELWVKPTFTFYVKKEDNNLKQVGNQSQLILNITFGICQIIGFDFFALTGLTLEKYVTDGILPKKVAREMGYIYEALIPKDKRLFVPFAHKKIRDGERKFYKEDYTIEDFRRYAFEGI